MMPVSRLTPNPNKRNRSLSSVKRWPLSALLMGLSLVLMQSHAVEPPVTALSGVKPQVVELLADATSIEVAESDTAVDQILGQTLLLSLADVSPVFSANYQQLIQWRHRALDNEEQVKLQQMQLQLDNYWQYLDAQAECITPCSSAALLPKDAYFRAVVLKLKQLMALAEASTWDTLNLEDKLSPGQESPLIAPIARRLFLLGFLPAMPSTVSEPVADKVSMQVSERGSEPVIKSDIEPNIESDRILPDATTPAGSVAQSKQVATVNNPLRYDDALVSAIKAFQTQHGLQADGVIGKQTLYWLNQSPYARAKLLAKNTLRQQIFTRTLPASYLMINIPAFELQFVEAGKVTLNSKVIVGKASRPTPLLSSHISSVVLNPQWRVPRTIVRRDILPHIRQDGHYLQDRGFDVYDYDGARVEHSPQEWQELASSHFPYRLVQRPGAKNALGRYKFHFDNSFSVYLHGTSEPSLFKKTDRALSSGCIRVEKVEELARWFQTHLVKDTRLWDKLAPNSTQSQWFALSDTMPVYTVYWTAWLDDAGQIQYRNDIYQLEAEFTLAVPAAIFYIL
ncbi:L,D-transpeptidase family protein [Shewanella mangrovisoli]|uniref:L,D-transpeptidase family protein n=1 Tax=Shewanella mangrovisoli TaxID=2864211 RepID=UPI001C65947D|nr:L,D-transpeptidase family protein [Shewanella mangrovisoli]QYK11088.1 L,D-transpeptidase family protein [Shewanella mangrovisoli]